MGLGVLWLVLQLLPGAQEVSTGPDGVRVYSITVNIDDTLFRRWGRKVHAAFWTHDGAGQGKHKIGRGNRWVVAGVAVRLPLCCSPVCLPVLFRLWQGKGTASHVDLAAEMIAVLVQAFPTHRVHGVGDAAYHGKALAVPAGAATGAEAAGPAKARTTWTTRLPRNATLYAPAPPPTGKPGRPRLKGDTLGKPADLAGSATWRTVTVNRYGDQDTIKVASVPCIWYGSFGNTPGQFVLVREPDTTKP